MQVILNQDVKKLGYRGDIVNVKRGYFNNYLFPRGLADNATPARLKIAEMRQDKIVMKKQQVVENAKDVLAKLSGLKVTIASKVTDKGTLYGAISEADVVAAVEKASNITLGAEFLTMEHFKEVGEYTVKVTLGDGLTEEITVEVKAE